MSKQDQVIKLLLIEDSVEEAEQIISMLRNGGIALRPARVETADELETYLGGQTPDLILANPGSAKLKLADVATAAGKGGKDIAIVAVVGNVTEDVVVNAFNDGARALALRNRAEHVQSIVRREFDSLNMRRGVRRLESALRETERRCDALLDSSRDPIAYVHEGMHVRANKAYLEIFGFEEFEDIEGMSILDMVAPDDADDFKTLLKQLSKGEKPPQKVNLKAQRGDGTAFDAIMEFTEASYEGETCQQIVLRQQTMSAELAK
ncbi:MAG TPA: PAS domain S-box protein, partial [Rudaea sp.]|nr:PAS domain S-box protein [Rudaea sp.]